MKRKVALFATTILGAMALGAQAAQAQTAPVIAPNPDSAADKTEGGDIVVTGSRVGGGDVKSPSPISVITAQAITDTGVLSLADVIRRDPAASAASRGANATLNGGGETSVNLRNLGLNRTLVLINGHRYAPTSDELGNAAQDIGAIPTGMIDRVEILRDGAATTYGADAVAGVVNIILKDNYNGLDAHAYYGISGHGDGPGYRVDASLGMANDRGSVLFTVERQEQSGILQDQRDWSRDLISGIGATAATIGSAIIPGGKVLSASGATIACFNEGSATNLAPACPRYSSSPETSLTLRLATTSVGGTAHYDIADNLRFNVSAFYTERTSSQSTSATSLVTSGQTPPFNSGYLIPATNSNNPYGVPIYLQWRLSQYGPSTNDIDQHSLWGTAGFSGRIFDRFDWDVTGTYSSTNLLGQRRNTVNNVNFYNLLNPSICSADPVCKPVGAVGNIANLISGTAPLTAAQRQYAFTTGLVDIQNISEQEVASIHGPLFNLPAGPVRIALGFEHRVEIGKVTPDENYTLGVYSSQIFPTNGRYSTNEAFGELQIPVLKDTPFAKALDVNLQGRYSHFSNFGGAYTYKIGVNYAPVEDVRFRATYGTSFRAPSVIELYGGGVGATGAIGDPCSATGIRSTNATVAANCAALGVPANYIPPPSIPTRSGGNPALQPEKGKSFTAGMVATPRFLPQFTLTADYFNFTINNTIGRTNITTVIAECYSDPAFLTRANNPSDTCFGYNARTPAGDLGRINNLQINLPGSTQTSGIDFAARFNFGALGFVPGALVADLHGSYLASYKVSGVENAGSFQSGVSGSTAYPRWQGMLDLDYTVSNVMFRFETQYIGAMRDFYAGVTFPTVNYMNYEGTPNYFLNNILLKWKVPHQNLDLAVGVNNVFDRDPPYAFVSTRNSLYVFDTVGRYVFFTIGKKF
ncbi:MAG: TonB-dependent receptor [Bradyrhizobium sp.]|nr:TonB-dependent receptor [Bradyrhizobium sp.]